MSNSLFNYSIFKYIWKWSNSFLRLIGRPFYHFTRFSWLAIMKFLLHLRNALLRQTVNPKLSNVITRDSQIVQQLYDARSLTGSFLGCRNPLPLDARITAPSLMPHMEEWFITDKIGESFASITPQVIFAALMNVSIFDVGHNQRYKALGTSVLKFCVTDYEFHTESSASEGALTRYRVHQLSHAHVRKLRIKHGIIFHKSIVALIGACYIQFGLKNALDLMGYIGLNVLCVTPSISSPVSASATVISECSRYVSHVFQAHGFEHLERQIGYTFRDRAFLIQAFTHPSSYDANAPGNYERLELLGDAVLDLLLTRYLFEHEVQFSRTEIADLRSALVNNIFFASLAVRNNLHEFVLLKSPLLIQRIQTFVNLLLSGTDFNDNFFVASNQNAGVVIDAPKFLADVFESLAGAIYLDSGMDLKVVWRVFFHIFRPNLEGYCTDARRFSFRRMFQLRKNVVRSV